LKNDFQQACLSGSKDTCEKLLKFERNDLQEIPANQDVQELSDLDSYTPF
jgi:hypothetical protein